MGVETINKKKWRDPMLNTLEYISGWVAGNAEAGRSQPGAATLNIQKRQAILGANLPPHISVAGTRKKDTIKNHLISHKNIVDYIQSDKFQQILQTVR
jgi:hypothetical protein